MSLPRFWTLDPFALALDPWNQIVAERLAYLNTAAKIYPEMLEQLNAVFESHPQARGYLAQLAALDANDQFEFFWSHMSAEDREKWKQALVAGAPLPAITLPPIVASVADDPVPTRSWMRPAEFSADPAFLNWAAKWRLSNEQWILGIALETLGVWELLPGQSRTYWAINDVYRCGKDSDADLMVFTGKVESKAEGRIPINDYDPFIETQSEGYHRILQELKDFKKNLRRHVSERAAAARGKGNPQKRKPEHLEWAARYFIGGETIGSIAARAGSSRPNDITEEAIRQAVRDIKRRIGLTGTS